MMYDINNDPAVIKRRNETSKSQRIADEKFVKRGGPLGDVASNKRLQNLQQQFVKGRLKTGDKNPLEDKLREQQERRAIYTYDYNPAMFKVPVGMRGPTAQGTVINREDELQTRGRQNTLADLLAMSASGQGPSLAEAAGAKQAADLRRQLVGSFLGRPGQTTLRPALSAAENVASQIGSTAALGRLQEQENARNSLAQLLQGMRSQDFGAAGAQAELDQQRRLANLQSTLQTQGAQASLNSQLEQMRGDDVMGLNAPRQKSSSNGLAAGLGAFATLGAAAIPLLSDKNTKTDISSANEKLDKLLDLLSAKEYEYKDKKDGKGKRIGVMAQDLEKSDLGADLVSEMGGKKMVDLQKLLPLLLASQVRLNDRLNELEG
jgi:hypothetical protein